MPSKGFNSILFDVSSIIDDKLTYIKFLKEEYSKEELENYFDADIIFSTRDKYRCRRPYLIHYI